MKKSRHQSTAEELIWEEWPEARVIAAPKKNAALHEPVVLVRRNIGDLIGNRDELLLYLPGPPVISLFTGAGGFDIGLEQAGFCSVVQHEWDCFACETLIVNRPRFFRDAALIQGDIHKTPTHMILKEANLRVGEAKLVVGGPPCQGFSHSGKRDPNDPRNDLVFEFLRVVREAQPDHFIFENVPGFLSLNGGSYFEAFLSTAYGAYYELVYGLMDAMHYGVPQHRNRFFCCGTRRDLWHCDGLLASLPKPQNFHKKDLRIVRGVSRADSVPAPGVRYFPDRPVLRPPAQTNGIDNPVSQSYIDFYRHLELTEPDRVVRAPMGGY